MAGLIDLSTDRDRAWSAAGWLFRWALRTLDVNLRDERLSSTFAEIIENNLGYLNLEEVLATQRVAILRVISDQFADAADEDLRDTGLDTDAILGTVDELIGLAKLELESLR